jgi:uncharacterized protein (DUF1015 family)
MNFDNIALQVPKVLLPKEGTDLTKWSIVACDQYTSQPEYWEQVKTFIENSPSTLNLTLPEVFLEQPDVDERIKSINENMQKYVQENILEKTNDCLILIDRKTSHTVSRKGLIVALDLEKYDYNKGSQTLIRATEGTVVERLPPRIKIREKAPIELPHIMVLIDDPSKTVIEPLFKKQLTPIYDFDLMLGSGHVKGYKIEDQTIINEVVQALSQLAENFEKKYGAKDKGVLLYAVGDGNHSLATAKACWERIKANATDDKIMSHPARFALVELVNIHDDDLKFEPIHRVLFNAEISVLLKEMKAFYGKGFSYRGYVSEKDAKSAAEKHEGHSIVFLAGRQWGLINIKNPAHNLEVGTLQSFLDTKKEIKIDYVHGHDFLEEISSRPGNIGFFLPPMNKSDLFKTVIREGALPRKTFSMGEASEKRFYLEARSLVPEPPKKGFFEKLKDYFSS